VFDLNPLATPLARSVVVSSNRSPSCSSYLRAPPWPFRPTGASTRHGHCARCTSHDTGTTRRESPRLVLQPGGDPCGDR